MAVLTHTAAAISRLQTDLEAYAFADWHALETFRKLKNMSQTQLAWHTWHHLYTFIHALMCFVFVTLPGFCLEAVRARPPRCFLLHALHAACALRVFCSGYVMLPDG